MRVSDLTLTRLVLVLGSLVWASHAFVAVAPMSSISAETKRQSSPPQQLWLVPTRGGNDLPATTFATTAAARSCSRHGAQQQRLLLRLTSSSKPSSSSETEQRPVVGLWYQIVRTFSQSVNTKRTSPTAIRSEEDRKRVQLLTLLRVGIPSILSGIAAYLVFPVAALTLAGSMHDPGTFSVLSPGFASASSPSASAGTATCRSMRSSSGPEIRAR